MESIEYDFTEFRKNFRALLDSRGFSLASFGDKVHIPSATTSRYLTGQREPTVAYLVKIATYFNVSIDWLLGLNPEKYEAIPEETREIVHLYSIASEPDRAVIRHLLSRYKA